MYNNPFSVSDDSDRHNIWDMLVSRDIKAFIRQDWSMVSGDFHEENFMGVDACNSFSPDEWKLNFPTLESYKKAWLKQAEEFAGSKWGEDIEMALFRITILRDIEISDNCALAHKKFFGYLAKENGDLVPANWQTIYHCRKLSGTWKISGFTGYMPHISLKPINSSQTAISMPENASQHKTAGPYSPVLVVKPDALVVISGQAAINNDGNVVGSTIEEQTRLTLENCRRQLTSAGCSLESVFKVNVFLKNLDDWPRCNEVYKNYFNKPLPVRTAVETGLLANLLVEIEMWAARS